MDYYKEKNIRPMLLQSTEPFDSTDFIYELKLDGARCIAYIKDGAITLKSRQNKDITAFFPELKGLPQMIKGDCILDGELVVFYNNVPDFYKLLKRLNSTRAPALEYAAEYAAFDILFLGDKNLMDLPLLERKRILSEVIVDGRGMSMIMPMEGSGTDFFDLVNERCLEGIVAKRKLSPYVMGKRTNDWLKIKTGHKHID